MEISNNMNNYKILNRQQREVTQPLPKEEPKYDNKEIYEASQGNLIRSSNDEIVLTPQGQNNINNKRANNESEEEATTQAQKDAQRANATDYLAHKSMKSQVEIYLAVATDGKVDLNSDAAPTIIESLRDVQKQNNIVKAYAAYAENQK